MSTKQFNWLAVWVGTFLFGLVVYANLQFLWMAITGSGATIGFVLASNKLNTLSVKKFVLLLVVVFVFPSFLTMLLTEPSWVMKSPVEIMAANPALQILEGISGASLISISLITLHRIMRII